MDVIAIDLIIGDNVGSTTIQLANVVKKSSNYQHFNLFWIFFFFQPYMVGALRMKTQKQQALEISLPCSFENASIKLKMLTVF